MANRTLILDLGLFEPRCGDTTRWSERFVFRLLELIAEENISILSCMRVPPLYKAGVRWIKEPPDREIFMTIPAILRDRGADCEDLAAWRVAELRMLGEPAGFVLYRWQYVASQTWLFSELRSFGEPTRLIQYRHEMINGEPPQNGDTGLMYHVLVQRMKPSAGGFQPWYVEDPSARLGMKSAQENRLLAAGGKAA